MLFWSLLALLWLVAVVLVFLVVVIFRQFGLLYIGSRALVQGHGLDRGSIAPHDLELEIEGADTVIDWSTVEVDRCWVVALSELGCPIMDELILSLDTIAAAWSDEADVLVVDRVPTDHESVDDHMRQPRELPVPRQWLYARSIGGTLHEAFDYAASPTVYVIGADGRVLSRELVGGIRQISAMLAYLFDDRVARLNVA
jgi:hypothetical protein